MPGSMRYASLSPAPRPTPTPVWWQGPSVGFDFGGNLSKVFTLVYELKNPAGIFRRLPGVDGSLYVVAGIGLNYQQAGDTALAPIRTGVGLRAGANVGYLHYTREYSWLPFRIFGRRQARAQMTRPAAGHCRRSSPASR